MKASVLAATIAGGAVLGAAVFVPFGGQSLVATATQVPAANQKIAPPADDLQQPVVDEPGSQSSETTNPNAAAAGIDPAAGGSTSGSKYSFGKGGDDDGDDEGDDDDSEDAEHEDEGDDD